MVSEMRRRRGVRLTGIRYGAAVFFELHPCHGPISKEDGFPGVQPDSLREKLDSFIIVLFYARNAEQMSERVKEKRNDRLT
jgi:hypothetical protein